MRVKVRIKAKPNRRFVPRLVGLERRDTPSPVWWTGNPSNVPPGSDPTQVPPPSSVGG